MFKFNFCFGLEKQLKYVNFINKKNIIFSDKPVQNSLRQTYEPQPSLTAKQTIQQSCILNSENEETYCLVYFKTDSQIDDDKMYGYLLEL